MDRGAYDSRCAHRRRHPAAAASTSTTSTIPQEAFLELDAVSFTKGCFIGQELVCRIDTRRPRQPLPASARAPEGRSCPPHRERGRRRRQGRRADHERRRRPRRRGSSTRAGAPRGRARPRSIVTVAGRGRPPPSCSDCPPLPFGAVWRRRGPRNVAKTKDRPPAMVTTKRRRRRRPRHSAPRPHGLGQLAPSRRPIPVPTGGRPRPRV